MGAGRVDRGRPFPTSSVDYLSSLNPAQREAVVHADGPLLILAGAGSGKTRVITYRMAHLIGTGLAEPGEVLAVTFTNKAAEEMRQRVGQLLGGDCRQIWLSTFHALCARLLRREAPAIGLTRDFVIYDSSDQLAVVKQAMKALDVDEKLITPRAALSRISQAKNRMESPESMRSSGWSLRDQQIGRVYEAYRRTLTDAGALDFDDLLLKTVELVESHEQVRLAYARRFRYVLVDEYQDTNRPQYLLVQRLAEVHRNLCVVGDPDQSIYRWRGADLRNILDFEHDFPDTHVVKLEQNYRSTQVILDAASAVIRRNRHRKDKRLWTARTGGDPVLYVRSADEIEEADFITRTIRESLRQDPERLVAVLYRTNAQSRAIEDALMREAVPYRIIGGVRFYERKEVKDTLAYLRLLINPHDDVSFRRVANVPARGIGRSVFDALERVTPTEDHADMPLLAAGLQPEPSQRSLWARLLTALDRRLLPTRATTAARTFRDILVNTAAEAAGAPVSTAMTTVLERSGYLPHLREERSEEAEARIENLMELVSAAREYRAPRRGSQPRRLRRSPLAALRGRRGHGHGRRPRVADVHARRQGAGVPDRDRGGHGGGPLPARAVGRGRGRRRGGAANLLRLHHARPRAPDSDRCGAPAHLRRVPGDRAVAVPRRDSGGADAAGGRRPCSPALAAGGLRAAQPVRSRPATVTQPGAGRRRSPTRTKISRSRVCAPGCASGTVSSASARSSRSRIRATTSRSRCASRPRAPRSSSHATRGSSRPERPAYSPPSPSGAVRAGPGRVRFAAVLGRRRLVHLPRLALRLAHRRDRHEPIALGQIHQPDALRVAANRPQVAGPHADDLSLLGHEQQLVAIGDTGESDHEPVAVARLDVLQADAPARSGAGTRRRRCACRSPSRRR